LARREIKRVDTEAWLSEQGHEISATRFYDGNNQLPSVDEIDALIILGGPMSVYADQEYNWLSEEKIFIRDCIVFKPEYS